MNARRLILLPFLSVVLLAGKLHAGSLQAVADLMNRIDTSHILATKVETRLDTSLGAREHFIICPPEAKGGSALIKGNTISALTTGLNWYLNHYAHINLSWNHLTTDMSKARLPKGDACKLAKRLFHTYLKPVRQSDGSTSWSYRELENE